MKAAKSNLAFLKNHRKGLFGGVGRGAGTTTSLPVSPAMQATRSVPGTPAEGTPLVRVEQTPEVIKKAAVKTALFHLLAPRPATEGELLAALKCDGELLRELLERWGRRAKGAPSKYELIDRAYKELDLFSFPYADRDDRRAAHDLAVRAFDRMRVQVDDPLWEQLVPKAERGQGKGRGLSRLNFNRAGTALGSGTPQPRATPTLGPQAGENERKRRLDPADAAAAGRSQSQGPIKKQKVSEKEAQSKRIFSKSTTKLAQTAHSAKPKDKPTPPVKEQSKADEAEMKRAAKKDAAGAGAKFKSAEKIVDSDEELSAGTPAPSQPAEKQVRPAAPAKPADKKRKASPPAPLPAEKKRKTSPPARPTEKRPKVSPPSHPADKPANKPATKSAAATKPAATKPAAAKPATTKPTAAATKAATAKKDATTPSVTATKPPAKTTAGTKRKAEPATTRPAKAARPTTPAAPAAPAPVIDPVFGHVRPSPASRRNSSTAASDPATRPSSSKSSSSSSTTPLMASRGAPAPSGMFGPLFDRSLRAARVARGLEPDRPKQALRIQREAARAADRADGTAANGAPPPPPPRDTVDPPTLQSARRFRAHQRKYAAMRAEVAGLPAGAERADKTEKLARMRDKLAEHKRGLYTAAGHLP